MMDIPIHGSNGENGQSSDASSTASSGYVKISMDSEGGFVDGDSPTRTAAVVEATAGGPSGKDFDEFVFMSTSATTTDYHQLTGSLDEWSRSGKSDSAGLPGTSFLHQKGFGWLLEAEEPEDDDKAPLL